MNVLVTGATGYIGGRLVPLLLAEGHSVRVLVRDARRLTSKPWANEVEVVQGDVHDPSALENAVEGMDAAYYLVHSMCTGPDFATRDRRGAETFVEVGRGLRQVIYLGGILPRGGEGQDSKHLRSRAEVGEILRGGLSNHRNPGRPHHWFGLGILRNGPLPHGTPPGHGGAQVDHQPRPTHRRG